MLLPYLLNSEEVRAYFIGEINRILHYLRKIRISSHGLKNPP